MPLEKPRKGLPEYPLSPLGNRASPGDSLYLDELEKLRRQPKITEPGAFADAVARILKVKRIGAIKTTWQQGEIIVPALALKRPVFKANTAEIRQLLEEMLDKNVLVGWSMHEGNSSKGEPINYLPFHQR